MLFVGQICIGWTLSLVGTKSPVQSQRGTPPVKGVRVVPSNSVEIPPMIGLTRSIDSEVGVAEGPEGTGRWPFGLGRSHNCSASRRRRNRDWLSW